jgi:chromosomal replication initiation ATPase DnaA
MMGAGEAEAVLRGVVDQFGTTVEMVRGARRADQSAAAARAKFIDIMAGSGASSVAIGKAINRDHATVLYHLGRLSGKRPRRAVGERG